MLVKFFVNHKSANQIVQKIFVQLFVAVYQREVSIDLSFYFLELFVVLSWKLIFSFELRMAVIRLLLLLLCFFCKILR
jgi:hypothetical protein